MRDRELARGIIYADVPLIALATMAMGDPQSPLWAQFQRAGEHLHSKDRGLAIDDLQELATNPNSRTQVRLLAWRWLRDMAVKPPPADAERVMAVVVEESDLYALYRDGTAGIVLADGSLKDLTDDQEIANRASPANDAAQALIATFPAIPQMPASAALNAARISLLTPSGIRSQIFGPADLSATPQVAEILKSARAVLAMLK